jgi:hypothetical protein
MQRPKDVAGGGLFGGARRWRTAFFGPASSPSC